MQGGKVCKVASVLAVLILVSLMLTTMATAASKEKVIHAFRGGADGSGPSPNLLADSAGNLYGTTAEGGDQQAGTVFELSPRASGGWTEHILYSFQGGTDGSTPSSGLIADSAGNLYGETSQGGSQSLGTVYELSPSNSGWTETVLYSFVDASTGVSPAGGLAFDSKGNLYGTTSQGGVPLGLGTVFQLTLNQNGNWTERVILGFGRDRDGGLPFAGLVLDAQGNMFGTTLAGYGAGTVYELTPQQNGKWKTTVLHRFTGGKDGANPSGNLILDAAGDFYGTAQSGGAGCDFGCGTVFKLTRGATGWKFSVLYRFTGGQDGQQPDGTLAFDLSGNLYGTTAEGGGTGCSFGFGCGTAFELSPTAKGPWTETVLHRFQKPPDGLTPMGGLLADTQGNWYGTTISGGANSDGTVFELTP
jgi:uncharacterized repeat protein (TIGR03803 family)